MLFIHKPKKIIAHMLVKNEEDIIQKNIEHHIEQGVSGFIITDNNSTDNTKEIISKIPEVLEIIDEPNVLYDHSVILTNMARKAIDYSPDWILNIDADEFWRDFEFAESEVCEVYRLYHHLPIVDKPFDINNFPYYLDCKKTRPNPRIIHKPLKNIIINHGNHGTNYKAKQINKTYINHYCIRSSEQFAKKKNNCKSFILANDLHYSHWKLWAKSSEDHFKKIIEASLELIELNKIKDNMFYEKMLHCMINLYGTLPVEAKRIINDVSIEKHYDICGL